MCLRARKKEGNDTEIGIAYSSRIYYHMDNWTARAGVLKRRSAEVGGEKNEGRRKSNAALYCILIDEKDKSFAKFVELTEQANSCGIVSLASVL